MKKALRIIVPLVLVVAVLASTAWYFLIYDRQLTKDMILWGARTLEERGNQEAAAWMYDLAYSQSSQEDTVAIELSEQYREYGNYTKAEYTLTEAISENPTPDLYIALSKLYVEQDKLLDAVNMLDTVHDPQIRATLEAQRPLAPTVSYEPGFYTQYISVEVRCSNGTPYVSAEEQYPSIVTDRYEAPISLGLGDTVLHCLCVGDNGLVSPLAMFGYTVGGVVEPVAFTDKAIEDAVRQMLNTGSTTTIYTSDLWNIKEFTLPTEAASFTDLAHLTRLETLVMENAPAGVLAQMGTVETLKTLSMPGSSISDADWDVLVTLRNLETLDLSGCSLSTISGLDALSQLKVLNLNHNTVRNLAPLGAISSLQQLDLSHNAVTDLSALSALTNLITLDVSHNSVSTLNPVCSIPTVSVLKASHNQISNVDAMRQLTVLQVLDLSYNTVADVAALTVCTEITELNISNNQILDISMLSTLKKLEQFDVSHNQVPVLPDFAKDCALVNLNASYNLLSSVEQLEGLGGLNTVNVDYNAEIESLKPLDKCHVLIQVNAHGTKVAEVDFLTEKSIIVNYDPTL